jgi:hypothetical protein
MPIEKRGTACLDHFPDDDADESFVAEAFRCGGSICILTQSVGEELITAIRISLLQKH